MDLLAAGDLLTPATEVGEAAKVGGVIGGVIGNWGRLAVLLSCGRLPRRGGDRLLRISRGLAWRQFQLRARAGD